MTIRPASARLAAMVITTLLVTGCAAVTPTPTSAPTAQPSVQPPTGSPVPTVGPSSAPPSTSPQPTGWQAAGSMVMPRLGERAALLRDGSILVVGNEACVAAGEPTESQRAELFDPTTGTWTEVGSLNKERSTPALIALPDGRAMVLGGTNPQSQPYSSTKIYAPAPKTWADGPLMVRAGATVAVTLPDGTVVAVGKSRAEILPASASAWRTVPAPPKTFVPDRLLVLSATTVLASGEADDGSGPSLIRFDVTTKTWTSLEPPVVLRPLLIVLADGSVLAIGDDEGGSHVQRLDPRSNVWVDTAQMATGRIRPQVTLLQDGRLLVAGGAGLKVENVEGGTSVQIGGPLDSTEIYDPTPDTWTAGPALLEPRQDGHALTLPDGSVVVFGGYSEAPDQPNPDTGTPGPCPTPLATTERLGPAS